MKANIIVVGGPISVGKSSLVSNMGYPQVQELEEGDIVQDLLLKATYEKNRVSPEVIEFYFLMKRKNNYEKYSQSKNVHIFDRAIFESLWFAKENMDPNSYKHFEKLWESEIRDLIKKFGKPKLYILLTFTWETFKERFFKRSREVEVNNFESNEAFFRKHVFEYVNHLIGIFKKFKIHYVLINTDNLSMEQVTQLAIQEVNKVKNSKI